MHLATATKNTMPLPRWQTLLVYYVFLDVVALHRLLVLPHHSCMGNMQKKNARHHLWMGDWLRRHMLTHGQLCHPWGSWWLMSPSLCVMWCHSFSVAHQGKHMYYNSWPTHVANLAVMTFSCWLPYTLQWFHTKVPKSWLLQPCVWLWCSCLGGGQHTN